MRFHSKPIDEHVEVPLADEGRLEDLTTQFEARRRRPRTTGEEGNACYVLSVVRGSRSVPEAQLAEIAGLVEAQGDRIVGRESQRLATPDPRTFIGRGVAMRVAAAAEALGADMLVVDAELTPSQTRNLEDLVGLPICDREAVILNVFELHATTPRARIQVEIAHLQYLRPRIRGIGLNMDQQAGGIMGSKGAGETASELFARRLDGRLAELQRRSSRLEVSDRAQRSRRSSCTRLVLVGYTNAGKTSLMNALTCAELSVRDRPFETLDTTSRALSRYGGDILISDTVGFIRDLPQRLYASFETTLAEAAEASLLVLVLDVSDPEVQRHLDSTQEVLGRLGAGDTPRFVVFNKVDQCAEVTDARLRQLAGDAPFAAVSAHDPEDIAALRARLLEVSRAEHVTREVFVPYPCAEVTETIYARCRVLRSTAAPAGTQFLVEGPAHVVSDIARKTRKRPR